MMFTSIGITFFLVGLYALFQSWKNVTRARHILGELEKAVSAVDGNYTPSKAAKEVEEWGSDKFEPDDLRQAVLRGHHLSWGASLWLIRELGAARAEMEMPPR